MKLDIEHVIHRIALPDYETLYFDEPFNEALCRHLRLDRQLISLSRQEDHLSRVVRIHPHLNIPNMIANALGTSQIEYDEYIHHILGGYHGQWRVVPMLFPDKIKIHGSLHFLRQGDAVLRRVQGEVKVHLFVISHAAELFIVNEAKKSYAQAALFTQQWIDGKQPTPA